MNVLIEETVPIETANKGAVQFEIENNKKMGSVYDLKIINPDPHFLSGIQFGHRHEFYCVPNLLSERFIPCKCKEH